MGETILVVEDSSDDRFFMGRALKRVASGLAVQFVTSGDEAVAYLNGWGAYADRLRFPYPAFVITDLNMEHGDGFTVLRQLQASPPSPARLMVLSDSDEPEDIRRAYGLGVSSYRQKPYDARELGSIISEFLDPRPEEPQVGMRVA